MKKRVLTWLTAVCMVLTMLPLPAAWAAETVTFSDVTDRNTAMAVETLRLMDVLDGYGDGTFRPEAILTRAQFCKMVVYAMGAEDELGLYRTVTVFPDVKPSHWGCGLVSNMGSQGKEGNLRLSGRTVSSRSDCNHRTGGHDPAADAGL